MFPDCIAQNYNSMTAYTVQNRSLKITGLDNKLSTDGKNVTITPKLETNVNASGLKYSYQIYDLESLVWTNLEMILPHPAASDPKRAADIGFTLQLRMILGLNVIFILCAMCQRTIYKWF